MLFDYMLELDALLLNELREWFEELNLDPAQVNPDDKGQMDFLYHDFLSDMCWSYASIQIRDFSHAVREVLNSMQEAEVS